MSKKTTFERDIQYYKFCMYGFLKNLRFYEAFIILYFRELGLSYLEIGTLISIREITVNLLEIPTGVIADGLGRRRTMIFSFAMYIISFVIFSAGADYWLLAGAMIFYAIGDAFRTGTHKAMIFEYLIMKDWVQYKVHYYGHTRSWSQTGSAVSSLIAAAIVFSTGGYRYIFIASIIPYILDLWLVYSYPKFLDGEIKSFKFKDIFKFFRVLINDFFVSMKNPVVFKGITNMSVYAGFYTIAKDYLQPVVQTFALSLPFFAYMKGNKREAVLIGVVYFVIYMLTSYASKYSGKLDDKIKDDVKPLNYTMILGFSMGILSGLLFSFKLFLFSIILFVLIYIIENLRKPIGLAYVSNRVDKSIIATTISFQSQLETGVAAILAPVLGYIADLYGVGIAIVVISAFLLLLTPLLLLKKNNTN